MSERNMSDSSRSYKFRPTPEELVDYFLPMKRDGNLFDKILDRPVYGDKLPWEVFTDDDDVWEYNKKGKKKFVYTFINLTRVGSRNYVRTAGGGTWEGATIQPIQNSRGDVIGHKRQFKFNAKIDNDKGRWIMHEYTSTLVKTDTALCKIIVDGFQVPKVSDSDSDVGSRKRQTVDSTVEDCTEKRPRITTEKEGNNLKECDANNVQQLQQISEVADQMLLNVDVSPEDCDVNVQQLQQHLSEIDRFLLNDDSPPEDIIASKLGDTIASFGELL